MTTREITTAPETPADNATEVVAWRRLGSGAAQLLNTRMLRLASSAELEAGGEAVAISAAQLREKLKNQTGNSTDLATHAQFEAGAQDVAATPEQVLNALARLTDSEQVIDAGLPGFGSGTFGLGSTFNRIYQSAPITLTPSLAEVPVSRLNFTVAYRSGDLGFAGFASLAARLRVVGLRGSAEVASAQRTSTFSEELNTTVTLSLTPAVGTIDAFRIEVWANDSRGASASGKFIVTAARVTGSGLADDELNAWLQAAIADRITLDQARAGLITRNTASDQAALPAQLTLPRAQFTRGTIVTQLETGGPLPTDLIPPFSAGGDTLPPVLSDLAGRLEVTHATHAE